MHTPNFFLVGAPKAGTTSLAHYLDQHPDIYMSPIKEPCHFSLEARPENFEPSLRARAENMERMTRKYVRGWMWRKAAGGIVREWEDYLRLFARAGAEHAVGEASVNYMWSETAAAGIAARLPTARILMVLRSPVERAFSQYLHVISDGHFAGSFHSYVYQSLNRKSDRLCVFYPFLEMGFYAEQVCRYLRFFPAEQVGIWFYEDLTSSPAQFLRKIFSFLDVDTRFEPDQSRRYNEPRVLAHMDAADRALLLDIYRQDIFRLQDLVHRNLRTWLT